MNRYLVVFLDDPEGRVHESSHYMVEGKTPKKAFKRALYLHWKARYSGYVDDVVEQEYEDYKDIGFHQKDPICTYTGTADSDALIFCIAENLK